MKKSVLIVEDDEDIQQMVTYNLVRSGFQVECASSGEEAVDVVKRNKPDIILLDIMLPGIDGLQVCRILRADSQTSAIPVIMMTARGQETDVVAGLDLGADDYVSKPFSPKVLVSRVKAVLRRQVQDEEKKDMAQRDDVIHIHDLEIDPGRHEVCLQGIPIQLTPSEFGILFMLAQKPGWVFTRQQILASVRGDDYFLTPRAMDVQVFGLRKKLGGAGKYIETVRGIGYRLRDE